MRSISTSFVALMPVLSLLIVGAGIFGATSLEDFALALAAGLFIGSYSSIFVAAPILAWWKGREPQYRALAERRRRADELRPRRRARQSRAPVVSDEGVADEVDAADLGRGARTAAGGPHDPSAAAPAAGPEAPLTVRAPVRHAGAAQRSPAPAVAWECG